MDFPPFFKNRGLKCKFLFLVMKFSLLFLKSDLINYYIHQEKEVGLLSVWFENSNKGLLVSILFNS